MRNALRAFLPTLAVLSMLVFAHPALAGMVATPKTAAADESKRAETLAILTNRLGEAGPASPELESRLAALSTADLLVLAATVESGTYAGHHHHRKWWFWVTVGVFVLLWSIFDKGCR